MVRRRARTCSDTIALRYRYGFVRNGWAASVATTARVCAAERLGYVTVLLLMTMMMTTPTPTTTTMMMATM
eukprot:6481228-Pyramimonas_sp.AAC.1